MIRKRGVGRPRVDLSDPDAARLVEWLGERFRKAEKRRTKQGIGSARSLYGVRTGDMVEYLAAKGVDEKKAYKCIGAAWRAGIIVRNVEPRKGSILRGMRFPTVNRSGKIAVPIVGRPLRGWWVVRDRYFTFVGPRRLPFDVDVNLSRAPTDDPYSESEQVAVKWALPQELERAIDRWLRGSAARSLRGLDAGIHVRLDIERLPKAGR
jgi:hypothetical protein